MPILILRFTTNEWKFQFGNNMVLFVFDYWFLAMEKMTFQKFPLFQLL